MWCRTCEQDVLVVPAAGPSDDVLCVICRTPVVSHAASNRRIRMDPSHAEAGEWDRPCTVEPPPIVAEHDDWSELTREVKGRGPQGIATALPAEDSAGRKPRMHSGRRSTFLCWLLLSLGVAMFVCGASLIGWSLLGEREELWNLGTPFVLAGQATFLIGLVLQLDVLWHQTRVTTKNLHRLDERIMTLQRLSEDDPNRLGSAELATPQTILTDLKGQLDQLADKLQD